MILIFIRHITIRVKSKINAINSLYLNAYKFFFFKSDIMGLVFTFNSYICVDNRTNQPLNNKVPNVIPKVNRIFSY